MTNMQETGTLQNAKWLVSEFLKIFYSPIGVAGGLLDAFRGWKFSRSWIRFWFHIPSVLLLVAVYLIFGFAVFSRVDSRIQLFSVESQKRCPTNTIEAICDQLHEEDFCKAIGVSKAEMVDFKITHPTDLTKRYVELLSKRILTIQNTNQAGHYRLGLIYSITEQPDAAMSEMSKLANGDFGDCPQANAWMAKELLKQKVNGVEVSNSSLLNHLDKASKWKDVDFRLISYYAKGLEAMGQTLKAIGVAKQAALTRPELNLELARLYERIGGYQEELKSAASAAEEVFLKKLNTPLEKESDRLAVAEARRMTNRLEQAADVLTEGLLNKSSGPAIKRDLSETLRLMYLKTIFKPEVGGYQADLTLLEKVAETDPTNPTISAEIARLLPLKIKATKKLMEVLRKEIESGNTSVTTHIMLAEGFLAASNTKEAIYHWEVALKKDPNNLGAMNNLALLLARTSESNVDRSLTLLNKALSLSPYNAEILDTLGDVLLIAKKPKEAINKFELAIKNDPNRLDTRKKLVGAYQQNGMDDMAKALEKVIKKMEKVKAEEEAKQKDQSEEN